MYGPLKNLLKAKMNPRCWHFIAGDYKLKKLDASGQAFEDADQDDYLMKEALRQEANRKPRNAFWS